MNFIQLKLSTWSMQLLTGGHREAPNVSQTDRIP